MVISPDRKKILLVKKAKSTPAAKRIDWNQLVFFLSIIMVFISVPSMFSASFSASMGTSGVTIFLICATLIALILGYLYVCIPFTILKIPLSGRAIKVSCFLITLGVALFPVTIYNLLTNQWALFLILFLLAIIIVLLGIGIAFISQKLSQNKISKRKLVGLLLVGIGLIIILISMSKPVVLAVIFFGNVCLILGFIFPISIFLMLLLL